MAAVVEICWGRHVEDRVKKTTGKLHQLKLWGKFENLTVWINWSLHLDTNGSLREKIDRVIVFVDHPGHFQRGWNREGGAIQDKRLCVAARLGGLKINEAYFRTDNNPGGHMRMKKFEIALVRKLEAEAFDEVQRSRLGQAKTGNRNLSIENIEDDFRTINALVKAPGEFANVLGQKRKPEAASKNVAKKLRLAHDELAHQGSDIRDVEEHDEPRENVDADARDVNDNKISMTNTLSWQAQDSSSMTHESKVPDIDDLWSDLVTIDLSDENKESQHSCEDQWYELTYEVTQLDSST